MHEYSIVQSLFDSIDRQVREHGASTVHRVWLQVGELSGVEIDLLRSAYELFREKTICAGADLEIRPVGARWTCEPCQRPIPSGAVLRCDRCGSPATLAAGDEIVLERLEMEVA